MKRIYIFAVLLVIAPGLFAQENTITAISITGLKRTKPYIIETPLQKFIGRDAESININEVIAIVKSSSIVEPLTAEIKDNPDGNGKTLVITVREKWSILPIPLFSIDTGGWSAGAVFVDTNAFGVKDNMVLVGNFGINEWMVMAMYIHPPASVGSFGWDLMGNFLFQESESVDQKDEQLLRRFNSMSINPSIGLSYKLTDLITPSISVSYRNVILRDTESPINAPEDGVQAVGITPGIGITHNTWDGYFLSEKSASLKYDYTLVIGAADVHSVSLRAALNHSIIPGLRFTAKTGIVFATPSASPFFESSPINAAVNILPSDYSAVNFSGISLGLEKYLFKFSFGTVSIAAAYQAVYSNGESLHNQFDHGPCAMLQMYFSKIAFPGMGLGAAYNVDKDTWQFAFNIGMMF